MQVFPDIDTLNKAAADLFISLCEESIAARGRFDVVLSGGSTPKRMFEDLAAGAAGNSVDLTESSGGSLSLHEGEGRVRELQKSPKVHHERSEKPSQPKVQWDHVHIYWGDERYVPPTDPQSNEGMARTALLNQVPIPEKNIHPMYSEGGVEAAAAKYEEVVRKELGPDLSFGLLLLGIGPDGHTASLFPNEPAVHETKRLVVAGLGHAGVAERITMTPPLLTRARTILFLVAGADKAEPMKRVLEGPENWQETPSQAIARHAPNVIWYLDKSAAALLDR